jgi:hypothetical protein
VDVAVVEEGVVVEVAVPDSTMEVGALPVLRLHCGIEKETAVATVGVATGWSSIKATCRHARGHDVMTVTTDTDIGRGSGRLETIEGGTAVDFDLRGTTGHIVTATGMIADTTDTGSLAVEVTITGTETGTGVPVETSVVETIDRPVRRQ